MISVIKLFKRLLKESSIYLELYILNFIKDITLLNLKHITYSINCLDNYNILNINI